MKENEALAKLLAEGRVQCVLDVENRDGQFWQKARVNHGEGITTDEWFYVETRKKLGRPPKDYGIDWTKVDWNKSSRELSAELNVGYHIVYQNRYRFGHAKLGTAKTRHIDWSRVDWNKNNQQIAGELGIMPGAVAGYRQRVGRPSKGYMPRVVSGEMIEAVDWLNTKDITLARLWGVSRERVRQIRLVKQKPRCVISTTITTTQEIERWLLDNKDSITGKLAHEVAEMCPVDADRNVKVRVMKLVDIPFLWRRFKTSLAITLDVNWDIPNNLLNWIWNRNGNWADRNRFVHMKPKAKWFRKHNLISPEQFASMPSLVKAVHDEIDKARKVGIEPKIKELREYGFDV